MLVASDGALGDDLDRVAGALGTQRINLSAALGRYLADISPRRRPVRVDVALHDALPDGPIVLDHIELLFEPTLQVLPVEALRRLARNRAVVAHWPGPIEDGVAVYAEPGHPEHVRAPLDGVPYVVATDDMNRHA